MTRFPCSGHDATRGMAWFARMLHKLRLHASGELPPDYVPWLGKGFDGRCCRFPRVEYQPLVVRTPQGGSDEETLEIHRRAVISKLIRGPETPRSASDRRNLEWAVVRVYVEEIQK